MLALLAESTRGRPVLPERRAPRWLAAARDYLEGDLAGSILLHDVAAHVGVHPAHLARTFRRHYGESLGEFLRRRRVEECCTLLSRTDTPLADVALAAGFFDQSHFCRTFRCHTGLTPSAYRRRFRTRNADTNA